MPTCSSPTRAPSGKTHRDREPRASIPPSVKHVTMNPPRRATEATLRGPITSAGDNWGAEEQDRPRVGCVLVRGISNPLEVIEQITYLMFVRRLDDIQIAKENRANRTGQPVRNPIYAEDAQSLRWSTFANAAPEAMFALTRDGVFPWLRTLGGTDSTYSHHMKDARFSISTPNLLAKVVDLLDELPLGEQDTKGDLYEYMLSKIATAGQNGQFRTPRHIIALIVEMMAPGPGDEICDPACGTAGFLVACAEYVNRTHHHALLAPAQRRHFNESMFHGFDFDNTMLRIGSMNMLQHEVEDPDIRYRDSLAQSAADEVERYSLILANPPFAGSLDYEVTAKDLQAVVKTKKTELLFLALFPRLLQPGGRAAVIVPDGVLFGSSKAHKELRRILVEDHKLDAVVKLPSGVFKPYAGVSTAILFFTKTNSGGTDNVSPQSGRRTRTSMPNLPCCALRSRRTRQPTRRRPAP
jgi:type I restriction enzyme M protein